MSSGDTYQIGARDVSIKDDKQYSRVIGTKTYGDDDEQENNVVGDVQTLDGNDDDVKNQPIDEDDNFNSDPNRHSDMKSFYGKVQTQSTTDRIRLGKQEEFNEDGFDIGQKNPNKSGSRKQNMNKSAKGKDLNKSGKGKQSNKGPTNTDEIFSKASDGPVNRSGKYKQSPVEDEPTPSGKQGPGSINFDDEDTDSTRLSILEKLRLIFRVIGSLISFMNLIGLIFYALKHEFHSQQLFQSFNAFVALRPVIILIWSVILLVRNLCIYKIDHHKTDVTGDLKVVCINGLIMYLSFPLMFWFGLFRVYAVKDFAMIIFVNYVLEFIQNIALIFVQGTNNAMINERFPTNLNKYTLGLTIISLIEIFLQLCIFFLEVRFNNKMRNEAIGTSNNTKKYEPLSEERRRVRNFRNSAILSSLGIVLFIMIIAIGNEKLDGRSCSFGRVLEGGVCVECSDQYCLQCSQAKDQCDYCMQGNYLDVETKQCKMCDAQGICRSCGYDGTCTKCISGYRVHKGGCFTCSATEGCAACSGTECLVCNEGYYLDPETKSCVKCSTLHPYCTKCNDKQQCLNCLDGVANLANGTCLCNDINGWSISNTSTPTKQMCSCNDGKFVDTTLGMRCAACSQHIVGCEDCQSITSYIYGHKYIGTTDLNPKQAGYLKCRECGPTKYLDLDLKECRYCKNNLPGCLNCDKYGQGCTQCQNGYFLYQAEKSQSFECGQCSDSVTYCDLCSSSDSCDQCQTGYSLTQTGKCTKN
ncbi:protein serine threonine [Stylonychia lemnae]|uniref:Protein serine threonine n=1 Tax=Stylonychia lemnae TaxID=5949 RepID=A0A078B780_STYLE|nr:protein serine threonine [Stylonychia lemnae]|eukprot:CDW89408.1 protein serine threonine [Stylonychia lemnae]